MLDFADSARLQSAVNHQSIDQTIAQATDHQSNNQSSIQSIKRSIYRSSIHLALPLFVFRYFFLLSLFVSCVVCVFSGGLGFPGVVVHSELFPVRSCSFVSFRSSSYINYSINQSINQSIIKQSINNQSSSNQSITNRSSINHQSTNHQPIAACLTAALPQIPYTG